MAQATDQPSLNAAHRRSNALWTVESYAGLPGFDADDTALWWPALVAQCERPGTPWQSLCPQIRPLVWADEPTRKLWLLTHARAYRVQAADGPSPERGLLTGYFEPVVQAQRQADARFRFALQGRSGPILYVDDAVTAMLVQVQGSARVDVLAPDGSSQAVRLKNAGSNGQPFRSPASWLRNQGLVRDASWEGVRAWLLQNPQRTEELLAVNPRVVYFAETPLANHAGLQTQGPTGALGVALGAGHSVAVDTGSVPLGSLVWIHTASQSFATSRMTVAQDVGQAIRGAVRADLFVGTGDAAKALAQRIKQPMQWWVLWPRDVPLPK